jgi:hypothetical protein
MYLSVIPVTLFYSFLVKLQLSYGHYFIRFKQKIVKFKQLVRRWPEHTGGRPGKPGDTYNMAVKAPYRFANIF